MGVNGQMDQLNFKTNEELLFFLHRKKTEISLIEDPHTLLTQLRDHDLIPDQLFERVKVARSQKQKQKGVYEVLDRLEKEKPEQIHEFWRCVFEDHILLQYPLLRLLKINLHDATFNCPDKPPDFETSTEKSQGKGKKEKERKNTRKRSNDDRDDEESGNPGPSSASTPKKAAKKPSFSTPLKKGDKIWTWQFYKTHLPVKCGSKEGTLYRDKLSKGGKCILVDGRWFTPSEFEKFGGKEKHKNWKLSIRCNNTPLKKLIEEKHLQCPPMERRTRRFVQQSKKSQLPVSSSESSSADSETITSSEEESDEDFQEQRGTRGGAQPRGRAEDEVEEDDMEELSVFKSPFLPVTCDSLTGTLYKDRFASGIRGKCIRSEESWFTPEKFVRQEPTVTDGLWRRDILCHGKTLNFLIKKKILHVHSLLCECVKCSNQEKDLMDQNNDDVCFVCESGGDLVCCDKCPKAFHSECHLPAVDINLTGDWFCTFCVLKTSQQWRDSSNMTEQEAFNAPISQYKLYCHYLLLFVYKEDIQRVFIKDPCLTVPKYSQHISQPMWLDKIKQKLESDTYQMVGQFISDFRLIFSNCRTFNRENSFGRMGAKVKEMFEKEFQKIFSITASTTDTTET